MIRRRNRLRESGRPGHSAGKPWQRGLVIYLVLFLWGILPAGLLMRQASADTNGLVEPRNVKVIDPFLEVRTGPGRGYPVFYVVTRDAWITLETHKTDWFRITTAEGKTGWVDRAQLELTLTRSGEPARFAETTQEEYQQSRRELTLMAGSFGSSTELSLHTGYYFTENLAVDVSLSQVLGDLSSSYILNAGLLSFPFPENEISPYFALGAGMIYVNPRAVLAQIRDTTNVLAHAGVGFKMYLTRSFMLRAEYNTYVIFTSANDNLEMNEWKIGVGAFY